MKEGIVTSYEVGILAENRIQVVLVKASTWAVRNDTLVFWIDDEQKTARAIFKNWCYIRRVEEDEFIRPLVVTREFVKNQISAARKRPSQNLLLEEPKPEIENETNRR